MTRRNVQHEMGHALLGRAPRDPDARTLADHLDELIEQTAIQAPSGGLAASATADAPDRSAPEPHGPDHAARRNTLGAVDPAGESSWVVEDLYQRAEGDPDVTALLDARLAGAWTRPEVLRATGLPLRRYQSAHRRLLEMVSALIADYAARAATTQESAI